MGGSVCEFPCVVGCLEFNGLIMNIRRVSGCAGTRDRRLQDCYPSILSGSVTWSGGYQCGL